MMKTLGAFLLSLLSLPIGSYAAGRYDSLINSSLDFLTVYQTTGTNEGYFPGHWKSKVTSYAPSTIGIGKFGVPYDDPSIFTAAIVANTLAEIYFLNPRFKKIPALVAKTKDGIYPFRLNSYLFSFYPEKYYHGTRVVGPKHMYLARPWWGFAHVPPDADTNSATYTYQYYLNKLKPDWLPPGHSNPVPSVFIKKLSNTRDLNRHPHGYNLAQGHINTGAFMTYLMDENSSSMPRFLFAPPDKGPRIPFAKNDVDCVVNANIINLLTLANKKETPGYKSTCNHLRRVVNLKQYFFCGMYYPSLYALPYSMANAMKNGAECLEPTRNDLLNYLIHKQNKDGSWRNSVLARPDYIQSSAWALNALLLLGDPQNKVHRYHVENGLKFLISQKQKDSAGRTYWKGEVYFAALFTARFNVVWRSTAYTTALAAKAFALADTKWNL
ncbi:hypothetical protein ACES2L_04325 [Bdellovibrio bacteriovorus]